MKGTNPIRPPATDDGAVLSVQSIFATLQGEGPYAGWPALFIRLGGCNLACTFCDTEFESFSSMNVADIVAQARQLSGKNCSLAVITGGEPLRQNIVPLCESLIAAGYKIQIETNGTLYRELPQEVDIICSPKNTGSGYHAIRGDLLPRVNAFKFIISTNDPLYHSIGDVGQNIYHTPVYIQPMDEGNATRNAANQKLATELALAHGCRLSLQLHKMVGIP